MNDLIVCHLLVSYALSLGRCIFSRKVSACDKPIGMHFKMLSRTRISVCIGALFGVHLVEPFLYRQHLLQQHSKLVPTFQQLYLDLQETEPCKLLNLNKAALTFITDSQFTHSRYSIEICRSIEAICEFYKPQVLKILNVILPDLAEAFQKQKGGDIWVWFS